MTAMLGFCAFSEEEKTPYIIITTYLLKVGTLFCLQLSQTEQKGHAETSFMQGILISPVKQTLQII